MSSQTYMFKIQIGNISKHKTRASLVAVGDVWAGLHGGAVSTEYLLLRLGGGGGIGWGCAGARGRPDPVYSGGGCLVGAARARGLARTFAVAGGGLQWDCADA